MSDLPDGWELVELQDLAAAEPRSITDGPFGSNLKTAHYTDAGPRVLRLQNIGFGEFIDEYAHISDEHFESLRNHEVEGGDLVVASLGENLPRSCVIPPSVGPAIVKADCIRVRLHADIDARYVNYALQRPELKSVVADQIHGVGRPRLGMEGIRALSVPLAPKPEQARIVAAIDEHLTRLDTASAWLQAALARLTALRRLVIDDALEGHAVPLRELLAEPLRNGISAKAAHGGSLRVLTLTAVTKRRFIEANTKLISPPSRPVDDLWLEPGDIFIQRSNTPELVGSAALYSGDRRWAIFPDLLIRVRVSDAADPAYVDLALQAQRMRRYFQRSAQGIAGSMPKISQPVVEAAEIPLPDLARQKEIVAMTTERLDVVNRISHGALGSIRRVRSLRLSLLDAAFSGRLVDQEPPDEPAASLLGRIQAKRSARARKMKAAL